MKGLAYCTYREKRDNITVEKNNKSLLNLLDMKNINFKGKFVLVLLFVVGILIKVWIYYLPLSPFWSDIIDVLGNSFLTAGILDIFLSFSNLKDILIRSNKLQTEEMHKYVDKRYNKSFFTARIAHSAIILASDENIVEKSGAKKENLQSELEHYSAVLENYVDICTDPLVYISEFRRNVILRKGEKDGFVKVHTTTDITYVNLTDAPYDAVENPQFFRFNGSGESYEIICFKVDGEDKTKSVQEVLEHAVLKPETSTSSWESGKKYTEIIPPHKAKKIRCESVYQILSADFYQAKIFVLPCMNFSLDACIDPDCFKRKNTKNYVFRWTVFETKFDCPDRPYKKPEAITEYNGTIHTASNFMKPGNGYVLTLGMIDKCFMEDPKETSHKSGKKQSDQPKGGQPLEPQ